MFKFPLWKIKRFIKGCIRTILFFVVISSFFVISFTCSAKTAPLSVLTDYYRNWAELVDDSKTTFDVVFDDMTYGSSSISLYPSSSSPDMFYALQNARPLDSARFNFFGNNVLRSFSANDVFIFAGTLKFTFTNNNFDPEFISTFSTFNFNLVYDNGDNSPLTFSLDQFEYDVSYNTSTGFFEFICPFKIEYVFPHAGSITDFSASFGDLQGATGFIVYPAQIDEEDFILYFIGPKDFAPVYELPDDSGLTDFNDAENNLIDSATSGFDEFAKFLARLPTYIQNVFNWVRGASDIFTIFFNGYDWPFQSVVYVLLSIGMLVYIIGITATVISKFER